MYTRSKGLLLRDRNNEDNGVGHPVYSNHWLVVTDTFLAERFATALEAEQQDYRQMFNTSYCSLTSDTGATLLQSKTSVSKQVEPR